MVVHIDTGKLLVAIDFSLIFEVDTAFTVTKIIVVKSEGFG